jgi:hypothetical protein
MTSERIKEIQEETAYPNSLSVQQALLKVWNECVQEPKQETLEELKKWKEEALIAHEINQKVIEKLMAEKKLMYSEEQVLPLLEMLEKCQEYFLLKTDEKSEERADALGQAIEDFKKIKNNKI